MRRPTPRIPLQTHNRRTEQIIERKAAEETRIASRRERMNTILSVAANLFAIPALVIGLLTYTDQRENEAATEQKEAGRVNYWWETKDDKDETPTTLVVENRSLNSAVATRLVLRTAENVSHPRFEVGFLSPCSRATFDLKSHGTEVNEMLIASDEVELYFQNPTGQIWSSNDDGVLNKESKFPTWGEDYIHRWKLRFSETGLDACG
ncbi:hypothetical protein ACWGDS_39240 [Streptomyces sp. NPDC055059]|uniref:hypothetical protein n=1 Tax=Streptomyces sp. NPDC127172 TaxID=3345382 RepID=UPI0036276FFF